MHTWPPQLWSDSWLNLFRRGWEHKSMPPNILSINYESWVEVNLHHKAKETLEYCTDVSGLAGGSPVTPEAPLPRPIRMVTVPTSPHLIPASAGGKLREEIGVVPPVSDAALVLDYLNGPLPPLCALTLGDLGLSAPSLFQSEISQSMSPERSPLN